MSSINNNPTNLQVNINTLLGQVSLARSEAGFTKSLRNLSTGLRVHSAQDDPVAFVAGTSMRTDLTSMSQAVSNCRRADNVISQIDSSLGSINSLLLDLRGLVTQAANSGAESPETLKALQMEADAILASIDRISGSTSFLDQNLIDGSLDFTTYGLDTDKITALSVNQASFLGRTEKDVSVQVLEQARQAELHYPLGALKNSVVLEIGGTSGYETFSFDKNASIEDIAAAVNRTSDSTGVGAKVYTHSTPGSLGLTSYGKDNDIILTASETGKAAGNFVVRYTAPSDGNNELSLRVTEGSGNDPTVIEVILQTEAWQKAEYHYNGENDGIPNNEFTIAAKYAGEDFNDIEFVINNVYGTGEATGLVTDLTSKPKTFTVNASYNEADPADPTNTTVADLQRWIAESPTASTYFELSNTPPSDGSGPLVPTSTVEQTQRGVSGGAVVSSAEQIATLLNTSPLLKNPDGTGRVSATIPTGSTGQGIVTPFAEVSYYGDPDDSNYLQFLAPAGSPDIQFVSTPGTSLSIDDSTYPPEYGYASAQVQGLNAGTSFTLRSLQTGPDIDGVGVLLRDSSDESVVYDAERNAVVISVDFSGRAADPDRDAFTMNDLQQLVAEDPYVSSKFEIVPSAGYDPNNPGVFDDEGYLGINARVGETSGGVISQGTVLIHLETDVNGVIKTTANDLVKFFNAPTTEESRAVLDRLEISVSNIDPSNTNQPVCTTGQSANGTGALKTSYDPNDPDCTPHPDQYAQVSFSSYGSELRQDYPTATIKSSNGIDSSFTLTATQAGATYNNTAVRVVTDPSGPTVTFNPLTKEFLIGVTSGGTTTANEIISLINSDPSLSGLFVASRAPSSTGEGNVAVGDTATLTGGIRAVDNLPEGSVVAANGVNASFNVTAKHGDDGYNNTEVRVVSDSNGPTISYDAQSKQLTIGMDPASPLTALQVVELINSTDGIADLFEASIPPLVEGTTLVPTGEDFVRVGDHGTLSVRETGSVLGVAMIGNSDSENLGLTFYSLEYGSSEFVSVRAVGDTEMTLTDRAGNVSVRNQGTDVVAKIGGQLAVGNGLTASVSTSDLDLSLRLDESVRQGDAFGFRISGGGTLIQLGSSLTSSQQVRIGIPSVHTSALGSLGSRLAQLKTGQDASLLTDTSKAYQIVMDVTEEISSLRGRLGAFQKYQVQPNMDNLLDAIEIETGALSETVDTDFAVESSEFSRQQIMMQSTVSVLQQSSQNTQLLLSLLQR